MRSTLATLAFVSVAASCGGKVAERRDIADTADAGGSSSFQSASADAATSTASCTRESWERRRAAPIVPPWRAADLDLARSGEARPTLADFAAALCASLSPDTTTDKATALAFAGPAGEIAIGYDTRTLAVRFLEMRAGYAGALEFGGWRIAIDEPVTRDGAPTSLSDASLDDVYRAMLTTFASASASAGPSCTSSGACVIGRDGVETYVAFPSLGATIFFRTGDASVPTRITQAAPP